MTVRSFSFDPNNGGIVVGWRRQRVVVAAAEAAERFLELLFEGRGRGGAKIVIHLSDKKE